MRIGQGYDIHIFREDRKLILGGKLIRDNNGLLGHSDADVLVHAVMDAMLGAAGLRDIGYYFPETDPEYKGISSLLLLKRVAEFVSDRGYRVGNIDATVIAEEPKLNPHIPDMIRNIEEVLGVSDRVAIKATTKEKMDATGEGRAMECMAICLLEEK